jgi:hypothetical protein
LKSLVWVAFILWGSDCLLIEEKKGFEKVNLLLPLPVRIFYNLLWVAFGF